MAETNKNRKITEKSIIVTTWNSYELTKNCLNSIIENTNLENCEMILVDNGSKNGSIGKLENEFGKKFEKFVVIKNRANKGFPYALNQGYATAKGEYIAYLNNDAVTTKGWLDELEKTIDSSSKIAVVGVNEVSQKEFEDKEFIEKTKNKPNREMLTLPVGWLTKKEMIEKFGYLDAEHFSPIYGEEADWNFRARSKGYKIIECSKCIAVHYSSQDSSKAFNAKNHYVLLNTHRLRSFFFNLGFFDLLRFVPGMGLIFLQSIKDGKIFWLLQAYWNNAKDWKMILTERKKRKQNPYIPFKEPKFTLPFELEK